MIVTDPDSFDDKSVLIFNHIPKCAGSTVDNLLYKNFPERFRCDYLTDISRLLSLIHSGSIFDNGPAIISGHHAADAHTFFPKDTKCFYCTTIRNPIELIQSQYEYNRRTLSFNGTFKEYILNINNRNLLQYAAINHSSPNTCANYALIGFVNNLSSFIGSFFEMLGISIKTYESRNRTKNRHKDISDNSLKFLKFFLKDDIEFYNDAEKKFKPSNPNIFPRSVKDSFLESTESYQQQEKSLAGNHTAKLESAVTGIEDTYLKDQHTSEETPLSINHDKILHDLAIKAPSRLQQRLLDELQLSPGKNCKSDTIAFYYLLLAECNSQSGNNESVEKYLNMAFRHISSESGFRLCLVRIRNLLPEKFIEILNRLPDDSFSQSTAEEISTFPKETCCTPDLLEKYLKITKKLSVCASAKRKHLIERMDHQVLRLNNFSGLQNFLIARAAPDKVIFSLLNNLKPESSTVFLIQEDAADNFNFNFNFKLKYPLPAGRFYFNESDSNQYKNIKECKFKQMIICTRDLNFYNYNEYLRLASWLGINDIFLYPFLNLYLSNDDRFLIKV